MVSALALILWFVSAALFLGGSIGYGLGLGVLAFAASGWAMRRKDDLEALWGVIFTVVIGISAWRGISFLLR